VNEHRTGQELLEIGRPSLVVGILVERIKRKVNQVLGDENLNVNMQKRRYQTRLSMPYLVRGDIVEHFVQVHKSRICEREA
jgi:hypothetical protein